MSFLTRSNTNERYHGFEGTLTVNGKVYLAEWGLVSRPSEKATIKQVEFMRRQMIDAINYIYRKAKQDLEEKSNALEER
jgi:hypothetical protein